MNCPGLYAHEVLVVAAGNGPFMISQQDGISVFRYQKPDDRGLVPRPSPGGRSGQKYKDLLNHQEVENKALGRFVRVSCGNKCEGVLHIAQAPQEDLDGLRRLAGLVS
ncbi:MAG: hypothetical protein KGQ58_06265 [Proteobacteria bacterium]|nr:hypothetical protein [Pseudomonadota bacterium]MDE3208106.1 hypothetical protein [Pseudomonadota bacterium]